MGLAMDSGARTRISARAQGVSMATIVEVERLCGWLTKDAGLLDPVEDPVDHLLSCDGEEGLDLLLLLVLVLSLVVAMVLRLRGRTGLGFDEGEQVDAVAARDDAAELGLRELVGQERVREHRHPGSSALGSRVRKRRKESTTSLSLSLFSSTLANSQLDAMAEMSPEQQLAQLQLLLSAVHRTRTALPRLVSTVTSSSSSTAGDRTTLYRTAHQECHAAITALQDQLDLNAHALDEHADHPVDPLHLPPPSRRLVPTAASWDQVRDILQTTSTTPKQGRRRSPHPPPPLPIPTTPANLEALIKAITQHYYDPRRVHIRTTGRVPPRQLELTLRGVLRAHISLRWEEEDGAGGCQADYVTCYSLMEDVRPLARSSGTF